VALALITAIVLLTSVTIGQVADPYAVADAYAAARVRGNVDALLPLFAPDATVTDRFGGAHTGVDGIREILQLNASRGQSVTIAERRVGGDRVSWVERVNARGGTFSLTAQAVVQNGRIQSLAFSGSGVEPAPFVETEKGGRLPAPLGLGAVLVAVAGGLAAVSVLPGHRPRPDASRPRGWLLAALRQWSDGLPR